MKPTVCVECSAPMWIVGAHSWTNGTWEVALICPKTLCRGWAIYGSHGKMATNRLKQLDPGMSRMDSLILKGQKEKERRRIDIPQADKGNVREYQRR